MSIVFVNRIFNSKTWQKFTTENGLASNRISTPAIDDKYVWVSSLGKGVSYYDKANQNWGIFNSESGLSDIRAIVADNKYVWFGTFSGGGKKYDKSTSL